MLPKSYSSFEHLPGSCIVPRDRQCPDRYKRIATEKARDKYNLIVC